MSFEIPVIVWIVLLITLSLLAGYSIGHKEGHSEGYLRGRAIASAMKKREIFTLPADIKVSDETFIAIAKAVKDRELSA